MKPTQVNYSWTVNYRLYVPRDFDSLYAIEEACFQTRFRFSRKYMQQIVSHSNSATWIAEEDGQMGGFAIAEWARGASGAIGYIQTIEVIPERRKQGLGRELLRRIEDSAFASSAQAIWLHVHAENAPAIHLYESHGYLLEGREEDYYAPGHAALIYGKPLSSEPAN
jgi:[ribosomal protein S18]-alanine N-acetyltransferase